MKAPKPVDLKKSLAPLVKAGWKSGKGRITKNFTFKDFAQAFSFMMRAAIKIDRLDHHPEWSNVYNKVNVELTTHDADGVTDKDIKLAGIMDAIAARYVEKKKKTR